MDAKDVVAASPEAEAFASALNRFLDAQIELQRARGKVPMYTGQYSEEDYIAEEQQARNDALMSLFRMLKQVR